MNTRTFAVVLGAVYTIVGILGFVPAFLRPPPADAPRLAVDAAYGYFLGLFPVNVVHSLVHLAVGVWGLIAMRSWARSQMYARGLAIIFGALTVLGLIPGLNSMFGLTPLWGHDIWLHGLTALAAAYFATRSRAVEDISRDSQRRAA